MSMDIESPPQVLLEIAENLRRMGKPLDPRQSWAALSAMGNDLNDTGPIAALKTELGIVDPADDRLERLYLWQAASQAIPRVTDLPLDPAVKGLLEKDLRDFAVGKTPVPIGSYHFNRAAKIATLRRFPAGPMEWEVSGIPRSWFLQARWGGVRLASFVASRLKGLGPCMLMHVAPQPRSRALVLEREVMRSYYRMAGCLSLRPELNALVACAWFHDPAAVRDYPHLEMISRPYLQNGGLITPLGIAPPDSGVLEGSAKRRAAYLEGKVRYRLGLAIWPRADAIRWWAANPALSEPA
jgi:hypothetical protein